MIERSLDNVRRAHAELQDAQAEWDRLMQQYIAGDAPDKLHPVAERLRDALADYQAAIEPFTGVKKM